jgi:hypothetical protein
MRTLGKIATALGVIGAIGISTVLPASAGWYGRRHRYYNYYGGGGYYGGGYGGDPNGCPPGLFTLQGGNCAPYKGPSSQGVTRGRAKMASATPILLSLSLYRWSFRVFDLNPMGRASRAIR